VWLGRRCGALGIGARPSGVGERSEKVVEDVGLQDRVRGQTGNGFLKLARDGK